ncbi:ribonuclease T2 family protein [Neptunicoccus sediminis]|uniref:ribonuclease T2 family protein n=1 Tax=Neptunicoccus sediminis TaxID=1892596 RepID=UPI0008460B3F|nr:ribonuclease T2 [Neptunicoccus sediminis]
MIRILLSLLVIAAATATPARAQGSRPGTFDYYVMALSWSPNWCALEGDARNSPQCAPQKDHGWVLHGLWPQQERGWPSYCSANTRAPSRAMTAAMADIMGTGGLAWHQWKKHGTCSGLSADDYYALSREAYARVNRPEVLRKLDRTITLPARVIEDAFLDANPDLQAEQITVTCKSNHIQEVRICLTRDLTPRRCGVDALRDCTARKAVLNPIR